MPAPESGESSEVALKPASLDAEHAADAAEAPRCTSLPVHADILREELQRWAASLRLEFLEAYPYPAFVFAYSQCPPTTAKSSSPFWISPARSTTSVFPVHANAEWDKLGEGRTLLDCLVPSDQRLLADWIYASHAAIAARKVGGSASIVQRRRTSHPRPPPSPDPSSSPRGNEVAAGTASGSEIHNITLELNLTDIKLRCELICTPLPVTVPDDFPYCFAVITSTSPGWVVRTPDASASPQKLSGAGHSLGGSAVVPSTAPDVVIVPETQSEREKETRVALDVPCEAEGLWTEVSQVLENMTPWKGGEALFFRRDGSINTIMRPLHFSQSTNVKVSQLLQDYDFGQTPLGPRANWDVLTHGLIDILQLNPMAGTLWIGSDLTMVYNQTTAELRSDHPTAWGQYGAPSLEEIRSELGPLTKVVFAGIAVLQEDELLMSKYSQNDDANEMYGSQMWLPIRGLDGEFGYIFKGLIETTTQVVGSRRTQLLKTVGEKTANVRSVKEFEQCAVEALASDPKDIPFALLFHVDTYGGYPRASAPNPTEAENSYHNDARLPSRQQPHARLRYAGGVGVPDSHPSAPDSQVISLLSPTEVMITEAFPDHKYGDPSLTGPNGAANQTRSGSPSVSMAQLPEHAAEEECAWPFLEAIRTGKPVMVKDCSKITDGYPIRAWKARATAAIVVPLVLTSDANQLPTAILVLGLSSKLPFDEHYDAFVHSLRLILTSSLIAAEGVEADLRRIESLASLDRAKSLLFSNVFHELFSPLSLIAGPLDDVLSEMGDSAWRPNLAIAQRNVRRLMRLVSMLTEVSTLEAGKLSGAFRPVNLGVITRDLAAMFRKTATAAGLAYFVKCDASPRDVYVDIERWEKILFNLVGNAVKHTREGSITVTLHYTADEAVLSVEDTGVGIPAADVSLIECNLNDEEISSNRDGAGIVLTLTKKLIQLHHGSFHLESRTERESADGSHGTVCRVKIPLGQRNLLTTVLETPASPPPQSMPWPMASPPSTAALWAEELEGWGGARESKPVVSSRAKPPLDPNMTMFTEGDVVMVVDDLPDSRRYIQSIFEPYCRVVEARDGQEALDMWDTAKPNLVITDFHLPRMGGTALLHALRTGKPEQKLVPFIMLMTAGAPRSVDEAFTADDYLSRPFSARELLSRSHMQLQLGKKRIAIEKEYNHRTAQLRVLTDLSPVGIFMTDEDGYITYANGSWYEISGYPPGPVTNWGDYVHDADKVYIRNRWEQFVASGSSTIQSEYRWTNNRWVATNIVRLDQFTDNMVGFIGTAVDVTERKLNEDLQRQRVVDAEQRRAEAEEARRQQELLIDITSHEIRNPISSLMQCSSLVKSNLVMLSEELRVAQASGTGYHPTNQLLLTISEDLEALDSIYQCGLTQERISNDVLSLGRIQLSMLQMFDVPADIVHEAQKIVAVFQSEARMKHIEMELSLGGGLRLFGCPRFLLDPVRLGQVIANLVSNAIRFTADSPVRKITLSIDAHPDGPADNSSCGPPPAPPPPERIQQLRPDDTVHIYVSVRDTGPGLTRSEHELLFQRFSQASPKTHTRFGGSGLGLFVSRKISELMGGRIEVLSEHGQGSEFRFFIQARVPPLLPPPPPATTNSTAKDAAAASKNAERPRTPLPRKASRGAAPKARILVVEDNLINRTVLLRQLKHVGMEVDSACNGVEALEKIRAAMDARPGPAGSDATAPSKPRPFDCVLMDLEMPVMDGYNATRKVREGEAAGELGLSSIIALTGNARQALLESAMADFTDVVIKPYRLDDLLQRINRCMQAGRGLPAAG